MKHIITLVFGFLVVAGVYADSKGDELVKLALNRPIPSNLSSTTTMTITDAQGKVKTRKMLIITQETPDSTKSLLEFLEPADVRGTKFLMLSTKGTETDQRLYLPALKKSRKIASSAKNTDFLGSDLYYFDMERHYFEDATYTWISDNETLAGFENMKFSKVSITFKAENSPYSRSIVWINPQDHIIYYTECFDRKDGALLKKITTDEVMAVGGYKVITKSTIANVKRGSHTQMVLSSIQINTTVNDDTFSIRRLEQ